VNALPLPIAEPSSRRPLLLICTDRAEIAARVILQAERDGFEVRRAERSELASEAGPDALILLDVRLGGPLGAGTISALRYDPICSDLPIVALVGDKDEAAIRDAIGAGADDFIRDSYLDRDLRAKLLLLKRAKSARDELHQRERDLQTLVELTRSFAGAMDTGTLLEEVTKRLAEELELRRCSLVLTDPRGEKGTVLATSDAPGLVHRTIDLYRYPEILEALRTRRAVVIEDAERHPLLDPVKEAITAAGLGTLAVLPLALEEELLGVLFLRSASPTLSPRAVDFAATVANATSVALRNARSVAAIRERVEQAEAKLQDLRQFEEIYQHVTDGIVLLDSRDGRVLAVNPAGLTILGLLDHQARNRSLVDVLEGYDEEDCKQLLREVAQGAEVRDVDITARRLDGSGISIEVSGASLKEGVVLLSMRDVTERKRFQALVSEQQEETARHAMIVELAGAAAHELNQPLTAVMGFAELLSRKVAETDPAAQQAAVIYREAERMSEIVRKIGRIVRYETKSYVGGSRIVDIDRAADDDDDPKSLSQ